MSEIRLNVLTGEWVIIAPERAKRGGNLEKPRDRAELLPHVASCPFCPDNEALTPGEGFRAEDRDGRWMVRSFVNKFSVLSPAGKASSASCPAGVGENVNGVGPHEVIVETPQHHLTLALMSITQVRQVLEAYCDRFRAFYADPRVRHVVVFKNHGADAGASQEHPHSQIVGMPIVPGQVVERIERSRRFFQETGGCVACQMIAEEEKDGCRVVAENALFLAFIPYAALSPYHLWIFPKNHAACFCEGTLEATSALAEILRTVLAKVYGLLDNPPFNLVIRSLAPGDKQAHHFHWYVSIVPRLNKVAGFELGTGMYVNSSLPENCARALREFYVP